MSWHDYSVSVRCSWMQGNNSSHVSGLAGVHFSDGSRITSNQGITWWIKREKETSAHSFTHVSSWRPCWHAWSWLSWSKKTQRRKEHTWRYYPRRAMPGSMVLQEAQVPWATDDQAAQSSDGILPGLVQVYIRIHPVIHPRITLLLISNVYHDMAVQHPQHQNECSNVIFSFSFFTFLFLPL